MTAHTPFLNLSPTNTLEALDAWCVQYLRGRGAFAATERDAETLAIGLLRAKGWTVEIPRAWETPGEFVTRLGGTHSHFHRKIHDSLSPLPRDCIEWCKIHQSGRRRVKAIAATKAFEAFYLANLKPTAAPAAPIP